jgi:hypothetical protein
MKPLYAALLLLFQLQPVFGTAICLGFSDQGPPQECQMPEHGAMPAGTVAQTGSPPSNCALASVCAPSPLAVVSLSETVSVVAVHARQPHMAATILFGISSARPFHPPRA